MADGPIRLIRPSPELPQRDPASGDEFALYALQRDIEHLKAQLVLWQERSRQKNVMIADEIDFLEEQLENARNAPPCECMRRGSSNAVSQTAMRRRISRLKGALHKFEGER